GNGEDIARIATRANRLGISAVLIAPQSRHLGARFRPLHPRRPAVEITAVPERRPAGIRSAGSVRQACPEHDEQERAMRAAHQVLPGHKAQIEGRLSPNLPPRLATSLDRLNPVRIIARTAAIGLPLGPLTTVPAAKP